jgi:hypothetical protein
MHVFSVFGGKRRYHMGPRPRTRGRDSVRSMRLGNGMGAVAGARHAPDITESSPARSVGKHGNRIHAVHPPPGATRRPDRSLHVNAHVHVRPPLRLCHEVVSLGL